MRAPTPPPRDAFDQPTARDARDEFLGRVVRGKSFCDVGGLWATVRERVSTAAAAGASALTMLDVAAPEDELWVRFSERMAALGVGDYRTVSLDLHDPRIPQYDVVHCSGVLYHSPDPVRTIAALRRMTREWLVLSCSVTPAVIRNPTGTVVLPAGGWLFLPSLGGRERAVVKAHWEPEVGDAAIGLTTPYPVFDPDDWGPWYWLPTVAGFTAMACFVGFDLVDSAPIWSGNAHTLLLRKR